MNNSKIYLDSYLERAEKICTKSNFIEKTILKRFVKFNSVEELLQIKERMIANHRREKGLSELEFEGYIAEINNKIELKQKEFDEALLKGLNKESIGTKVAKLSLQKKKQIHSQIIKISRSFSSISIPKPAIKSLNINKNILTSKKFRISRARIKVAGVAVAMGISTLTLTSCNPTDKGQQQIIEQQKQMLEQQNQQINKLIAELENQAGEKNKSEIETKENKVLPGHLAFDIQDRNRLKESIVAYVKDSLPKGIHFTDEELELEIGRLINTYYLLHIDEFNTEETYLLYGNTEQTPRKIYDDAMGQVSIWANDSVTASIENNTVLDLFGLDANKKARKTNLFVRESNAAIYDALITQKSELALEHSKELQNWIDSIIENPIPDSNLLDNVLSLHVVHYMKAFLNANYRTSLGNVIMSESEETKLFGIKLCATYEDVEKIQTDMKDPLISSTSYQQEMMLSLKEKIDEQFYSLKEYVSTENIDDVNFDALVSSICEEIRMDNNLFSTFSKNPELVLSRTFKSSYSKKATTNNNGQKNSTGTKTTTTTTTVEASAMTVEQKAQVDQQANLRKYIKINGMIIYTDELQKYSQALSDAYMLGSENAVEDIEEEYSQKATRHKYDYFGYDIESGADSSWDNDKSSAIWSEFVKGYNATWSSYKAKKKDANKANDQAADKAKFVDEKDEIVEDNVYEEGKVPNPELDAEEKTESDNSKSSDDSNSTIIEDGTRFEPVDESQQQTEPLEQGKVEDDSTQSSSDQIVESGSMSEKATTDTKSATDTAKEAIESAGHSDVEITVETETTSETTFSFNTFRNSFINQLKGFRDMLAPQKNTTNSMYCTNKTETNSYVKTLQKVEPVVQSKTI